MLVVVLIWAANNDSVTFAWTILGAPVGAMLGAAIRVLQRKARHRAFLRGLHSAAWSEASRTPRKTTQNKV